MLDIIMRVTFLSVQNKYPATRFICKDFDKKMNIDDQKVQVADDIKRYVWKYLVWSCMHYIIFYNFLRNWVLVANFLQNK